MDAGSVILAAVVLVAVLLLLLLLALRSSAPIDARYASTRSCWRVGIARTSAVAANVTPRALDLAAVVTAATAGAAAVVAKVGVGAANVGSTDDGAADFGFETKKPPRRPENRPP